MSKTVPAPETARCRQRAGAALHRKVIVFDTNARKLEGNPQAVTVIAEFPSMAKVERFYFSAEYTEAKKIAHWIERRLGRADPRFASNAAIRERHLVRVGIGIRQRRRAVDWETNRT